MFDDRKFHGENIRRERVVKRFVNHEIPDVKGQLVVTNFRYGNLMILSCASFL